MQKQQVKELDLNKYQELLNSLDSEATWDDVASLTSQHFTPQECFILGLQTGLNMPRNEVILTTDKTIN